MEIDYRVKTEFSGYKVGFVLHGLGRGVAELWIHRNLIEPVVDVPENLIEKVTHSIGRNKKRKQKR